MRHLFGCKPKMPATYGSTYDCPRCGQHWVSLICFGSGYAWTRHSRPSAGRQGQA